MGITTGAEYAGRVGCGQIRTKVSELRCFARLLNVISYSEWINAWEQRAKENTGPKRGNVVSKSGL
jgi:hypothetical protein